MHFFVRRFYTSLLFVYFWHTARASAPFYFLKFFACFLFYYVKYVQNKNFLFPAPPKAFILFNVFSSPSAPAEKIVNDSPRNRTTNSIIFINCGAPKLRLFLQRKNKKRARN